MKNRLLLLLLATSLTARAELLYIPATTTSDPSPTVQPTYEGLKDLDAGSFLKMNRKTFESVSGKKLTLDQRFRFHQLKRKVKRNPGSFDPQALVKLSDPDTRKFHWASIVALCCGVAALFSGLFSIPALVFGAIGLGKSGPDKPYKGKGFAITGLVIGIVGLVLWLAVAAAL